MRPDGVTPEMRLEVLRRDGWRCVAPRIAGVTAGYCRNRWNDIIIATGKFPPTALTLDNSAADGLTLDHVQDGYGRMGKRAPSDRGHLVTLCWHHHLNGWATAHRPELRHYIAVAEGRAE